MSHVLVEIKSKPGIFFAIDREDAERVGKMPSWFCAGSNGLYLRCSYKSGNVIKRVALHRFVMGGIDMDDDLVVDHINGNTLDNRKCNLRIIKQSQNVAHRANGCNKNSKSGIRGLYWCETSKKWMANINKDEKVWWRKSFDDKKEAERELALKHKEYQEFFGNYSFSDKEFQEPPEEVVRSLEELKKMPRHIYKPTKENREKYNEKRREATKEPRTLEIDAVRELLKEPNLSRIRQIELELELNTLVGNERRALSRKDPSYKLTDEEKRENINVGRRLRAELERLKVGGKDLERREKLSQIRLNKEKGEGDKMRLRRLKLEEFEREKNRLEEIMNREPDNKDAVTEFKKLSKRINQSKGALKRWAAENKEIVV